jgi:hypothetical protein
MNIGYIKLHRRVLDSGWLQNPDLWTFWCYCLLKATHAVCYQTVGLQRVKLEPGQFVFGRKATASDLKMSEQRVRTLLSKLILWQNLTIKVTNKYSVVTIVNWGSYQGGGGELTNNPTNEQPTTNQQLTTNKNVKNGENNKKKEKTYSSDSDEIRLAEYFIGLLDGRGYEWSGGKKPDLQKWAAEFNKLIRIDKRAPNRIREVLSWCQADGCFWQPNILSPTKLRDKWGQLTEQMKNGGRSRGTNRSGGAPTNGPGYGEYDPNYGEEEYKA